MKLGRNEKCHCGSGLKYKKCCLHSDNPPTPKESPIQYVAPPPSLTVAEFDALMAQKLPGKGSESFTGICCEDGETPVRIDVLRGMGLNQFAAMVGSVPARTEMLEYAMIPIHNDMLKRMMGMDEDHWTELDQWKDVVIRTIRGTAKQHTIEYTPIRVPHDGENIEVDRPAYDDTISLTPLEYGLATIAIAGSTANNLIAHQYEKNQDPVLRYGMFSIHGDETGRLYHSAQYVAGQLGLSNVHRVLN